jgi:hypothetical protein
MLTIKELKSSIDSITPNYVPVTVGDFEYISSLGGGTAGDGLLRKSTGELLGFADEISFSNFATFIGAPSKFLLKLNSTMRKNVIDYMIQESSGVEATVTVQDSSLLNIFKSNQLLLPPNKVFERVLTLFGDEDVISKLDFRTGLVMNVRTSDVSVAVSPGDITEGGIRFNATHGISPEVSTYMERLVCTNGMVVTSEIDKVPVRGYTLTEVLDSMEKIATHYLNNEVPNFLDNWGKLKEINSKNPEQLIHRLSRENSLSPKVETRIIEAAASLTDSTYYDVVNLITSFQHAEGVDSKEADKLQVLGGNAVRDMGGHRCTGCAHLLDA